MRFTVFLVVKKQLGNGGFLLNVDNVVFYLEFYRNL